MWQRDLSEWIPWAGLITGKQVANKPLVTRFIELIMVGILSGYVTLKTLEYDVSALKVTLATHEISNEKQRDQDKRDRSSEDAKWDARITRIENCLISHGCGIK